MAKIITADLYNLIRQYSKEEITLSRFAELLNEIAEKESVNNKLKEIQIGNRIVKYDSGTILYVDGSPVVVSSYSVNYVCIVTAFADRFNNKIIESINQNYIVANNMTDASKYYFDSSGTFLNANDAKSLHEYSVGKDCIDLILKHMDDIYKQHQNQRHENTQIQNQAD